MLVKRFAKVFFIFVCHYFGIVMFTVYNCQGNKLIKIAFCKNILTTIVNNGTTEARAAATAHEYVWSAVAAAEGNCKILRSMV
jgi:hypothetical protein